MYSPATPITINWVPLNISNAAINELQPSTEPYSTLTTTTKIVNKRKLQSLKPIVRPKEIELFASERY